MKDLTHRRRPPMPPTHFCQTCGTSLWDGVWPYALCEDCQKKPCKHGNIPPDCRQCDLEGDLAYDAAKGN